MGGNSTLHQHCRKHYNIYKGKCETAGIPVNHHVIPPRIAQAQEREKKNMSQMTLDKNFVAPPEVFKQEAILHAITQFVACDDQVSMMLDIMGTT